MRTFSDDIRTTLTPVDENNTGVAQLFRNRHERSSTITGFAKPGASHDRLVASPERGQRKWMANRDQTHEAAGYASIWRKLHGLLVAQAFGQFNDQA